ncbi:MAG: acyltransferase family protein [Blastocatellales bacterium]
MKNNALPARLQSMDAYRGLVMFLMMAEVLHLSRVYAAHPESLFWKVLAWNQTHVEWFGCSLHDLIQPSFSFLVGVALPYSIASRVAKGQSRRQMYLHAAWRALVLILLGVFLRSVGRQQTYWTFEDTLSQIGLGYLILFALGFRSLRTIWISLGLILIGYWAAFLLYPMPPAGFDYAAVGVPDDWQYHSTGLAGHFNKNSNLAWAFDTWFLNLFPREKIFTHNGGGYATLSFIPTLGTMILGLICGLKLKSEESAKDKMRYFLYLGLGGILLGLALHYTGICPLVKRIWTPTWTIFSGGACFLLMALFYYLIDMRGWRKWSFWLVVIGMNSIFIYVVTHLWDRFIIDSFKTHFGQNIFSILGDGNQTLLSGGAALIVFWLILYWMYKKKIFIKI